MTVNDEQLWKEFEAKLAEQGTTVVGLKGASEDAFLQILAGFEYNLLTQWRLITMINTSQGAEECKKNELIPCPAQLKIHTYVCRKRCSSRLWILQAWRKISQSFNFPSITSINTARLLP